MNFWDVHGPLFLLGCTLFPRITVILFSGVTGGPIFWIFFLLFPRICIPIIAAANYWETNPVLVVLSFLVCLGGEGGEKGAVHRTVIVRKDRPAL